MSSSGLSFALDQNFPPLLPGALPLLPEVRVEPLHRIDPRLGELSDRELVIYLHQAGWSGLITNNYKMLYQPHEVAAIVKTKLIVFAVRGVGDDPVRATGAVLLDLPGGLRRITRDRRIFLVGPRNPDPEEAWSYMRKAASRRSRDVNELYREVKVTDEELNSTVLIDRV